MSKPSDLIHGTLDLLILNTISLQPQHGWAIAKRIQQVSQGSAAGQPGGAVSGSAPVGAAGLDPVGVAGNGGRQGREVLHAHQAGRTQLAKELEQWERMSNAVGLVIRMAPEGSG